MASFNCVILMGNLTRDPQVKYLPNQTAVAEFGLAVSRKFKSGDGEDREEVCFVDCATFGKQAETLAQYMTKGKPIHIQGRLKFDSWDDKNGGGKRSKLSVIVDHFQFVGKRDDGDGDGQRGNDRGRQDDMPGNNNVPSSAVRPRQSAGPSQRPRGPMATAPAQGGDDFQHADIPFAWPGRDQMDV